jgi:hypothetical protein
MGQVRHLTAVIELEDDVYVALCPEFSRKSGFDD